MDIRTEHQVTESTEAPTAVETTSLLERWENLADRLGPRTLSTFGSVLLAGVTTAVIFLVFSALPEPDPAAVAAAPLWPAMVFELSLIVAAVGLITRSNLGRVGVVGVGAILAYLSIDCLLAGHTGIDLTMGAVGGVGLIGLAALIRR